jgi:hypothetical protein
MRENHQVSTSFISRIIDKIKTIMKKLFLFGALFLLASTVSNIKAQSIENRNWKSYISAPVNDTATFHIYSDSSFVTNSKGRVQVRFHSQITNDTLILVDYGSEETGCPDIKGTYKIKLSGDSFTLTLVDDTCEGRSFALTGKKWMAIPK